jgi:hypothetical protein
VRIARNLGGGLTEGQGFATAPELYLTTGFSARSKLLPKQSGSAYAKSVYPVFAVQKQAMEMTEYGKHGKP